MGRINNPNQKSWLHNDLFAAIFGAEDYLAVYNKDQIEDKQDMVLIAIHDPDRAHHPDFKVEGFKDVLQMNFWDSEQGNTKNPPLTYDQGKELREFIESHKDSQFLIHCSAGISRSAGTACAVECIVNYDRDSFAYKTGHSGVKDHYRYSPNWTVYDRIINDIS